MHCIIKPTTQVVLSDLQLELTHFEKIRFSPVAELLCLINNVHYIISSRPTQSNAKN